MFSEIRALLTRHPLVRDALLWSGPALLAGLFVRGLLLSYLPYANWNADSRSYYSFAHQLTQHGYVSLYDKRRYLYPIFLWPVSLLPGAPMRWLLWIQHGLGLISLVPLAYLVRRTLGCWKLWIVPVTVIYAVTPAVLWFERELLAETLFFDFFIWMLAGWAAWMGEERAGRARRLFWWFYAALCLFMLTKPAGRFFWPGLAIALVLTGAWRRLGRYAWGALAALLALMLTMGSPTQSAWFVYVSCFPLTKLESPLHAEYKAEIRDKVEDYRSRLEEYYEDNGWAFDFLRDPSTDPKRPAWAKLHRDEKLMRAVYKDLAKEAIRSEPLLYARMGVERLLASVNPDNFNAGRFSAEYYPKHFEHFYDEAQEGEKTPVRALFALPKTGPLPSWAEFRPLLGPATEPAAARWMIAFSRVFDTALGFLKIPERVNDLPPPMLPARPTLLGWWLLAGVALAFTPRYRRTLGVWTLATSGYLAAVFLATIMNARYFDVAWPLMVVLLALPADFMLSSGLPVAIGARELLASGKLRPFNQMQPFAEPGLSPPSPLRMMADSMSFTHEIRDTAGAVVAARAIVLEWLREPHRNPMFLSGARARRGPR